MKRFRELVRRVRSLVLCFAVVLTMFGSLNSMHVYAEESEVEDFVTRLYNICLERDPDAGGLQGWVNSLMSGTSGADTAYGFLFSPEFIARNLCDDCYVTSLYQCFLGREPDAAGREGWVNALAGGQTRGSVFNGFVGSQEFTAICASYGIVRGTGDWSAVSVDVNGVCSECGGNGSTSASIDAVAIKEFVTRLYNVCLDRQPDAGGLQSWVNALQSGTTGVDTAYGFIFSQEFINKNLCTEHFVEYMYEAFFNRNADTAGKASWVDALNGGASRGYVVSGFAGSQEFASLCASYGIKAGNTDYSGSEFGTNGVCVECADVQSIASESGTPTDDTDTEQPAQAPAATEAPAATAQPAQAPAATEAPAATAQPTHAPEATEAPTATAQPTQAPAATAQPTQAPAATEAPAATAQPTQAPVATEAPVVTEQPTQAPTPTAVPTQAPHQHSFGAWEVTRQAACETAGVETRTCTSCGETETRAIVAAGHNYSAWTVKTAATCTTQGAEERTCSRCGETETRVIAANGHSYSAWGVKTAATCEGAGVQERTCRTCGNTETQVIAATGHNYSVWKQLKIATCTEEGEETRSCKTCGKVETRVIPTNSNHLLVVTSTIKEPTCDSVGYVNKECTRCGFVYERVLVSPLGHVYSSEYTIVEPTCTTVGSQFRQCIREGCDGRTNVTSIPATGHIWGEDIKVEATCTADGSITHECRDCGVIEQVYTLASQGHDYVYVSNGDGNCVERGTETGRCTRCSDEITRDETGELYGEHDWAVHAAVPATCTEAGLEEYSVCSRCGVKDKEPEVIPALGHDYSGAVVAASGDSQYSCNLVAERRACSHCGEHSEWQIIQSGHGHCWKETDETYNYDGQENLPVYRCEICGLKYPYTLSDGTNSELWPRSVWGILYFADLEHSVGWNGASLYTLTGRIGVDKTIEVDAPAAKPGYHFAGWRVYGSTEIIDTNPRRNDGWEYMDYVFEAVYEPD